MDELLVCYTSVTRIEGGGELFRHLPPRGLMCSRAGTLVVWPLAGCGTLPVFLLGTARKGQHRTPLYIIMYNVYQWVIRISIIQPLHYMKFIAFRGALKLGFTYLHEFTACQRGSGVTEGALVVVYQT